MNHSGRIIISLSDKTIYRLKRLEKQTGIGYSKHVEKAILNYLKQEEKKSRIAKMRDGYLEMGAINLQLANDCPGIDANDNQSI